MADKPTYDELVAALQDLADTVDPARSGNVEPYFKEPLQHARNLIARAEGRDHG